MRAPIQRAFFAALCVSVALLVMGAGNALADSGGSSAASPSANQPFLNWGDSSTYELAPDGDFAQGLSGWSVSGAADLTPGSEPWSPAGAAGGSSLELPAGSSATSPTTSITADDPTIRFFAVNQGDPSSLLTVSVSFSTLAGIPVTLPLDTISSNGSWAPSPTIWLLINHLAGGGSLPVQFTFTPLGGGDWQIDDLYVDPWGET